MTMFGLKDAEVAPLVRQVLRRDVGREEVESVFARAAWSGIAEPGDRVATTLVAALGPTAALSALVVRTPIAELAAALPAEITAKALSEGFERWLPRVDSRVVLQSLSAAARCGARLVTPDDDDWPTGLDDLGPFAPLALWVRGIDPVFTAFDRSIALVGARAATGYGEHVAMESSAGLVDRGYTIVSGAAYGIDGMAHRAALASGGGTMAFLAGGVDRFYPSGHDALLTRMVAEGAVISELPCGSQPTKWRFLQRNRLISASSLATVVLEAGWRSGSLNTAGHAAQLGRPLGAVPGPVTSTTSAGCHRLLREGNAICVTSAEEMAELAPLSDADGATAAAASDPLATRLLDALSNRTGRTVEEIATRSGLSAADVRSTLAGLDLEGAIVQASAGGWKLAPARRTP